MRPPRRPFQPLALLITIIGLLLANASPARAQAGLLVYVPNQSTNNVVVLRVDTERGTLTRTGQELEAPSPICFKMALASW